MNKNTAHKNPPATFPEKFRREIQLDESQMAIYKNGSIDILDPAGKPIDRIGQSTKWLNDSDSREDVVNNLRLIEELLLNSIDGVELSERAVVGLADTFARAQRMIV